MEKLFEIFSPNLVSALGWSLVHSLWQGILLSLIYAISLNFIKSSEKKYFLGISLLFLQIIFSTITYFSVYESASNITFTNIQKNGFWKIVTIQSIDNQLDIFQKIKLFISSNLSSFVQIWLVGILFFLSKLSFSFWYVNHLKTVGLQKASRKVSDTFNQILEKIQIKQSIEIFESSKINLPMVIGHFKPLILLPLGLASEMNLKEIEAVLIHEIAHIKRNDFLFNLLQSFVEIVFFFHPAIWWISGKIREERENCCDDFSVKFTNDKMLLVNALARIASFRQEPKLAMAFGKKRYSLLHRVKRILDLSPQKNNNNESIFGATILLVFLGIYLVFNTQKAVSQTPKTTTKPIQSTKIIEKPAKNDKEWENAAFGIKDDTLYHKKGVMHYFNGKTKVYVTREGEIFINGKKHILTDAETTEVKKHIAEIEILEKEMKPLSDKMEAHGKEMEVFGKRMESYSPPMEEIGKQMEFQGKKIEENARMQVKYANEMMDLDEKSSRYKELEKLSEENQKRMEEFGKMMEKQGKEMEVYGKQMEKYEAPMDSLGKLMQQYEKPMEELGRKIEVQAKAIEAFFPAEIRKEMQRNYRKLPPPPPPEPTAPKAPKVVKSPKSPLPPPPPPRPKIN